MINKINDLVAQAEDLTLVDGKYYLSNGMFFCDYDKFTPMVDWEQGGKIIERERIKIERGSSEGWVAISFGKKFEAQGQTRLIAGLNCYLKSKNLL